MLDRRSFAEVAPAIQRDGPPFFSEAQLSVTLVLPQTQLRLIRAHVFVPRLLADKGHRKVPAARRWSGTSTALAFTDAAIRDSMQWQSPHLLRIAVVHNRRAAPPFANASATRSNTFGRATVTQIILLPFQILHFSFLISAE